MKIRILIFGFLLIRAIVFAQDRWQIRCSVEGDLPNETDVASFQSQIESAINVNADSCNYQFNVRVIANQDTTIKRAKIVINGKVKETKDLDNFADAIETYFKGKYQSAHLNVRYTINKDW